MNIAEKLIFLVGEDKLKMEYTGIDSLKKNILMCLGSFLIFIISYILINNHNLDYFFIIFFILFIPLAYSILGIIYYTSIALISLFYRIVYKKNLFKIYMNQLLIEKELINKLHELRDIRIENIDLKIEKLLKNKEEILSKSSEKEGILLNKIKDFELPEINGGIKC